MINSIFCLLLLLNCYDYPHQMSNSSPNSNSLSSFFYRQFRYLAGFFSFCSFFFSKSFSTQTLSSIHFSHPYNMHKFSMIVAATDKLGIGFNGGIPWKIPQDMSYFKDITSKTTVCPSIPPLSSIVERKHEERCHCRSQELRVYSREIQTPKEQNQLRPDP